MARWKARGRLAIRINWTFFAICYGYGIIGRNVYSSAVFAGDRPLCTQILPKQGHPPSTILDIKKTRVTGLRSGEDRIPLLYVPLFRHNS